jgi:hypothetical protein
VQLRAITPVFSGICFDIADSIGGINRRCKSGINRALRFLRSASSLRDALAFAIRVFTPESVKLLV